MKYTLLLFIFCRHSKILAANGIFISIRHAKQQNVNIDICLDLAHDLVYDGYSNPYRRCEYEHDTVCSENRAV